ncbi:hypothetical protein [Gimesia sp.]|uniref:hypothetical protein n=1 Tax=Gimesia sp. TaxID=2024833 RepID=UPI003A8E6114
MNNATLSTEQRSQAEEYEKIVDEGLRGYIVIGIARMNIQSKQLHEGDFGSYVMRRFDMKDKQAYRTIRTSKVAQRLQKVELPPPKNEGQAHLLHELFNEPEDQIEFWRQLLEEKNRPSMGDIKRFAVWWKQQSQEGVLSQEASVESGELASEYHIPPVFVSPEVNPEACLDIALQQIRTAANALNDSGSGTISILERIEKVEEFLNKMKQKLMTSKEAA